MLYAIMSEDVADSLQKRQSARPEHLARLQMLQDVGHLVLAGPHPIIASEHSTTGFSGSLVVAEFDSLVAAQNWADADPYLAAGVYICSIVKPFKQVFPK